MLRDFLESNQSQLVELCRAKVAKRGAPRATPAELEFGIPFFLGQLTRMFPTDAVEFTRAVALSGETTHAGKEIEAGAVLHGGELLLHHFTIEQVVHDYGDLCQAITELAGEHGTAITVHEFGVLNITLDNAIAGAVTEYMRQHVTAVTDKGTAESDERLGSLAHEIRNLLNTTILAISAIKRGSVGFSGATAAALDRSLIGMRDVIDRTLVEVRLETGEGTSRGTIDLRKFIADVQVAATLEAAHLGVDLSVSDVEPGIFLEADSHILASAVTNLLQNAFKFSKDHGHVWLDARAKNGRVMIEVHDECGGLPAALKGNVFKSFTQHGTDRSGIGLGLSITRKAVEANGGTLTARDVPGLGCVFTIELPQKLTAPDPLPIRSHA